VSRSGTTLLAAALAALAASGCTGLITGGSDDDSSSPVDVGGDLDGARVGGRGLRRLTTREYDNTVRDVFALPPSWPGSGLSPDSSSPLGFDNDAALLVIDGPRAQELELASEAIADLVVDGSALGALPGCGSRDRSCAQAMIDLYAPLLFRRSITDTDRRRYLDAYDGEAGLAADEALKWTLVAMLNSPYFLYRFELGTASDPIKGDGIYQLTGEEVASALSYTFSESPPSEGLLQKARQGALDTPEARLTIARQLLDTPRGHAMVEHFGKKWLHYDDVRNLVKDDAVVPGFADLRADMADETRRFLEHVFFDNKDGVTALFSSAETYVTPALAQHYGLGSPGAGGLVTRPPEQALGLLAQGSILSRFALTAISSPPQRGAFVWRHLLCRDLGNPPPNAGMPPVPDPAFTTRERFEQAHSTLPSCAGCHAIIDGIGFGLENFDTAGRWRTTENGKPIDPTGQVVAYDPNGDRSFADAAGLAELLAHSDDVAKCVGGLMSAYAFGDAAARDYVAPAQQKGLGDGSVSLYEFFAQLAAAPEFTRRIEKSR
jgi:hypothetical protein